MARKILLTIADIAEMLNVSERTVRNLVRRKELAPPHKVAGSAARWFRSDVRDYLARLRAGNFPGTERHRAASSGTRRQSAPEG